jgi:hypothetical protein
MVKQQRKSKPCNCPRMRHSGVTRRKKQTLDNKHGLLRGYMVSYGANNIYKKQSKKKKSRKR